MADKTMPPNDPLTSAPAGAAPGDMGLPAPAPGPQGGDGSVMISMPKVAFDAIHQLIVQLATGVDNLAKSVSDQASGSPEQAPAGPPSEPAMPSEPSEGGSMDEEFLNSIAKEGNMKK